MRVLVTGSQGYIGSVLTDYFVNKGYEVIGLDNGFFEDANFIQREHEIKTLKKDLRDVKVSDLSGFDSVVHLAGISNDPLGQLDPNITFEINHEGTVNLAKLSKKAGVKRFAFSSSCSMYGVSEKEFVTEEDDFNPQTPYAQSKVFAERDLSTLADSSFSPIYLRNSTVFGLSPRMRFDLVVNSLVAFAITEGVIRILSDGTPWRPLVHIKDVCQAFDKVLTADKDLVHNQAFNVGRNDNNLQIKTIANFVSEVIPDTSVEIMNEMEGDTRSYKVSFNKINEALNFKAVYSVKDGIIELYDYLDKSNFSKSDFQNPLYTTLKQVENLISENKLDKKLRWR